MLQKVKYRKRLKVKLEMAKFLQDTVEEISLQKKGAQSEKVHEFKQFMEKVSTCIVKDDNGLCRENTARVAEFLPPATKLQQGNVFTPICDSVHGGGGGGLCPSMHHRSHDQGVSVGGVVSIQGVSVREQGDPPVQ